MADSILVEKTQGVAIVTMNRPEQLNAMNAQLGTELREAVTRMSADDDVGCIVITGAGDRAFSAGVVAAEEAHRIGLLNHLVPCAELRDKTMWLATMIAKNRREAVMGVKALLLRDMGCDLEEQWANERDYTTNVVRGAKAEAAFPEFIARRGRPPRDA